MSTGPGPTRKDGAPDATVADIVDLLAADDSSKGQVSSAPVSDDGLDVMLETPGPVVANSFLPPPPSPVGPLADEGDSGEESGSATNLAYEDLLAKLVLPAKAPEPEPHMPEPASSMPSPEPVPAPVPTPTRPSSPTFAVASPTEDRTLVTENPLVAEEQEAAYREGRSTIREEPRATHKESHSLLFPPKSLIGTKPKLFYLTIGSLLVLGGMGLGILVLKLIVPTPPPQHPAIAAPAAVPAPPSAPPTRVEPLPPTEPVPDPAAARPSAAPMEAAAEPAAAEEESPGSAPDPTEKLKAKKLVTHLKPVRVAAGKPVVTAPKPIAVSKPIAAPKPVVAAKPAAPPKPAQKPAAVGKASKGGKAGGYVDPFDN